MSREPQSIPNTDKRLARAVQPYEQLLLTAQQAQAAADASVAELAGLRRRLAEAPRVLEKRTEELTRARSALEKAEQEVAQAREQMARKQADAARLIELAADAQQTLARALVNEEAADPEAIEALARQMLEESAPVRPMTLPASYDRSKSDEPRVWTPPPSPADVKNVIVEYMAQRDALCPSCGQSLRGITAARCPSCRLQLSIPVLQSVAPRWYQASKAVSAIRIVSLIALVLTFMFASFALSDRRLPGCGVGSECDFAFTSPWSKIAGIPVALLALPMLLVIFAATFRLNLAFPDPTRRRAWTWISGLSFLAAGAGAWFLIVQLFIIKAICPLCMVANTLSLLLGVLVLLTAPLNRPEKLPPRASGPVTINKPALLKLTGVCGLILVLFIGGHAVTNASRGKAMVVQPTDPNANDPNAKSGGLLMGGDLDFVPNPNSRRPLSTPEKPKPSPTPTPSSTNPKPEGGPVKIELPPPTPVTTPTGGFSLPAVEPEKR
ncbi:MAG: vitamin K epoxide reductase family protein [Phycisphaeraceae bacterium]